MNVRNTSLSGVNSVPIPKTGPVKSQKPEKMNDSAENCQVVFIVGERCSHAQFRGVRALRAQSRVKNQPNGWNSHKILPPNMRFMTT